MSGFDLAGQWEHACVLAKWTDFNIENIIQINNHIHHFDDLSNTYFYNSSDTQIAFTFPKSKLACIKSKFGKYKTFILIPNPSHFGKN